MKNEAEANKNFWRQKALEMFDNPFTNEGWKLFGLTCTKQEAIERFEKYTGYTLNELGVKLDF
jgi:hypothetical protein